MVDCDQRLFRVHIAACRAGRPRSRSLAQRNPPPTNRYCPHRHHQQQHPGWTEGGKGGTRGGRRGQKGGMKLASSTWRRGVCGGRGGGGRGGGKWTGGRLRGGRVGRGVGKDGWGRKRPLCYPELSVSVCMSVLTQSKSICHQDCHCGTKREGSLPGRTHSERNGERQRQAQGGAVEFRRGVGGGRGNLRPRPHLQLQLQTHLP